MVLDINEKKISLLKAVSNSSLKQQMTLIMDSYRKLTPRICYGGCITYCWHFIPDFLGRISVEENNMSTTYKLSMTYK